MCGGVEYQGKHGEMTRIYFPNPAATLPVKLRSGAILWVPWGRRREQVGRLPQGGWARLDSIHAGKWERHQPRPVIIPALRFMEKDENKNTHWFKVPAGAGLQGLLAADGDINRVYVVTVETPPEYAYIHDRWPRLVGG